MRPDATAGAEEARAEDEIAAVTFADLFDGLGSFDLDYSAAAQELSGRRIAISGYLSRTHGPAPVFLLVDQPGLCPDCSPVPAAAITLPGLAAFPHAEDVPVRFAGRLDFGFRIDDGTASFLRLEAATPVATETQT